MRPREFKWFSSVFLGFSTLLFLLKVFGFVLGDVEVQKDPAKSKVEGEIVKLKRHQKRKDPILKNQQNRETRSKNVCMCLCFEGVIGHQEFFFSSCSILLTTYSAQFVSYRRGDSEHLPELVKMQC